MKQQQYLNMLLKYSLTPSFNTPYQNDNGLQHLLNNKTNIFILIFHLPNFIQYMHFFLLTSAYLWRHIQTAVCILYIASTATQTSLSENNSRKSSSKCKPSSSCETQDVLWNLSLSIPLINPGSVVS